MKHILPIILFVAIVAVGILTVGTILASEKPVERIAQENVLMTVTHVNPAQNIEAKSHGIFFVDEEGRPYSIKVKANTFAKYREGDIVSVTVVKYDGNVPKYYLILNGDETEWLVDSSCYEEIDCLFKSNFKTESEKN